MPPPTCDRAHTLSLPLPIPRSRSHKMRALDALHPRSHKTSVSLYPLAAAAHPFPHSYPLAAAADLHLRSPRRVQVWPLSMPPPTLPALISSRCCRPPYLKNHTQSDDALDSSHSSYRPLPPATYQGLAAYRVIRWDPSEVICCIGEDLFVPDEHRHVINQHLLRLFEEKINTDQPFLEQAQRRAVVFIRWAVTISFSPGNPS
ncbi:hypothetical protein HETIRDRAFT_105592 [Heterobasidion irregulare TC 32-1]|uniref:Uncharacterized protein n=1 Tax=Heterobasidion irregulare (strain TC 32-1) TaxID=747525 RepID=W4JWH9_HETIT|nr:uncharacterized protein HETIRDRAFT_105592 [Heterobasidion irregulare TC 32-1]ETW77241.1 hypothetical protein HETIRDRAFT_105592 [Heterobasidion irregulare TC 32-1]